MGLQLTHDRRRPLPGRSVVCEFSPCAPGLITVEHLAPWRHLI
jgi:hypothetical protein